MRPLRYSINVTLDGCCDYLAIIPEEDLHRHAAENLTQADWISRRVAAFPVVGSRRECSRRSSASGSRRRDAGYRGLTYVALTNSEQLSAPNSLGAGEAMSSSLAQAFVNAFVTGSLAEGY